jgi:ATP-binding cassette subfamily C protein
MIGRAALEIIGIGAIPIFMALLIQPETITRHPTAAAAFQWVGATSERDVLLWSAAGLVLVFLLKNTYIIGTAFVSARYTFNLKAALASRLFGAYLFGPYVFHLGRNSAELMRNVTGEVYTATVAGFMPVLVVITETALLLTLFGLLLAVDPVASLVALGFLAGPSLVFYRRTQARSTFHGKDLQAAQLAIFQTIAEALGSIKETRVLGREDFFLKRLRGQLQREVKAYRYRQLLGETPRPFIETVAVLGLTVITGLLLSRNYSTDKIIPILSLFGAAALRMLPSFNSLVGALTSVRYHAFAMQVVHDDLRSLEAAARGRSGDDLTPLTFNTALELEHLGFRYPGSDEWAIRDVSMSIPRGSAVALIGPTGSGKTTVVDLILGLLTPTEGTMRVDGVALQAQLPRWQRNVGYVPQEIYLVDDTLRSNIAFGVAADAVDEKQVWAAVRAAQLEDFVGALPEGLSTLVGERGVRLSGGQRQRIGIARALYHRPEVLIMDEATSALDHRTEQFVIEAINSLKGDRTLITIAHRTSTVRNSDRLFLIDRGRLVASGSYHDLVRDDGEFKAPSPDVKTPSPS